MRNEYARIRFYYILFTATHSFKSSPSGSITASLKLPEPRVAAACFIKSYWWVPSGIFFFGLKVFEDLLPLKKFMRKSIFQYLQLFETFRQSYITVTKNKKKVTVRYICNDFYNNNIFFVSAAIYRVKNRSSKRSGEREITINADMTNRSISITINNFFDTTITSIILRNDIPLPRCNPFQ